MNKFNFISKQFSWDLDLPTDQFILYSLLISSVHDLETLCLRTFHSSELYRKKKIKFSVCLDFSSDQHPGFFLETILKKADLFLRLFLHPNFNRSGNRPIIFIVDSAKSANYLTEFIPRFNAVAALYGTDNIEWIYLQKIDAEKNISTNCVYQYTTASAFENMYYQLLQKSFYVGYYIGIVNNSEKSTSDILNGKLTVEEKFKNDFPNQYAIAEKYVRLENEMPLIEEKLKLVTEELKNQQLYLALLRAEDEANKINNFYYNEYEILPLWYKQFGHIIKMLLGKRTFKSLYNPNVKKYKN
jgi:hypothetical protein